MVTRRQFTSLTAAAGAFAVAAPHALIGQPSTAIRLGNSAGIIDPQLTFLTVGQNKRVNYYAEEGVALEIINMSGSGQTVQAIASGNVETSAIAPVAFLNVFARNPDIDVIFPYCWLRHPHWSVAVKPDSPIKSLSDLKGRKVGIRNQGDTGYIGARAMFVELGINPDADLEWIPVGEGGPAGQAIYRGQVDAMAFWDAAFARIELAGFPLRHLPNSPGMQRLFGAGYAVRRSDLSKRRDFYVRFFRAMAKGTVFAAANPDLSIRLHWEVYPESKPKGLSDQQAMDEARKVLASRKDKWLPAPWQSDKRLGAMSAEEWAAQIEFAGLKGQIKDVSRAFTTDLLDEINQFDHAAVAAKARSMTI